MGAQTARTGKNAKTGKPAKTAQTARTGKNAKKEGIRLIFLSWPCLVTCGLALPQVFITYNSIQTRIGAAIAAVLGFVVGAWLIVCAIKISLDDAKAARLAMDMHAEKLKEKFINRSYLPAFFWDSFFKEMQQMPLSDLAVILRCARDETTRSQSLPFQNKKRIGKLTKRADDTETLLAKKILDEEFLYVLEDERTCSAVLNSRDYDDCIMVFYAPLLKSQYWREVSKNEIKNYLYVACTLRGARGCIVHGVGVAAEKLLPEADSAQGVGVFQPVNNPDMVRAFTRLALLERPQGSHASAAESAKDAKAQGIEDTKEPKAKDVKAPDAERIEALWQELAPLIAEARFLVPVKKLEIQDDTGGGRDADNGAHTVRLEKGTKLCIPMLVPVRSGSVGSDAVGPDVYQAVPVFSDRFEFSKLYSKCEYDGLILSAEELCAIGSDTLVLNPASLCYELSRQRLCSLLNESAHNESAHILNLQEHPDSR